MDVKPIKTEADYDAALAEVAGLMDAEPGTEAGDRLDLLTTLIEAYEAVHHAIDLPADPIDALVADLENKGFRQQDLVGVIGSRSRVYEIIHKRRALTLPMIQRITERFGTPAEFLIKPYDLNQRA